MIRVALVATVALALASACDALAPGDHPGDPLFAVGGAVNCAGNCEASSPIARPSIGLLWWMPSRNSLDNLYFIGETAPLLATFPTSFSFELFEAPPAQALYSFSGFSDRAMAAAAIVAYSDVDNNRDFGFTRGDLNGPDRMLGIAALSRVVYVVDAPSGTPTYLANQVELPVEAQALTAGFQFIVGSRCIGDTGPCPAMVAGAEHQVDIAMLGPDEPVPQVFNWAFHNAPGNQP